MTSPFPMTQVRLTTLSDCGGCAAKLGADLLADALAGLGAEDAPADLIAGLHPPDDAAVYRLSPDLAVIGTLDFFPPLVDDPETYGAIAAANALSDVFAMGGRVLFAMAIAALPEDLPRLFDFLEQTHEQGRIRIMPAHTLGYYTRLEPLLRPRRGRQPPIWMGCEAGLKHFVVECDGKVKGCISLPSNFAAASIRERPIAEIWADDEVFAYTRAWQDEWFDGECAGCAYRDLCRAGCTAVAYGSTGSVGYNPYCLHRVTGL